MPVFVFSIFMTLVSLGATILIVMLIIKAVENARKARQEAFYKALDRGVYDVRLLGRTKGSGKASLGWGIFFVAVGLGIFFGLAANVDPTILRMGMPGALIPFFIGVGLIVFYFLARSASRDVERNGEPMRVLPKIGGSDEPIEVAKSATDGGEDRTAGV